METNRHAIKAHRGETFTIDKVLVNRDGSPYIISNELQNPYLLISVTNSEYAQNNRFVRNYWLDLENFPRFTLTQPLSTNDIIGWSDDATIDDLTVEIDGEFYTITAEFAVLEDNGKYIYWNDGWKPYECRFIKTFFSHDTKDWPAQTYLYSIQLTYGLDNREYLEALADDLGIVYSKNYPSYEDWDAPPYMSNSELYENLVKLGQKFPDDYDPEIPLRNVSSVSLLPQSELMIVNYAQGGVY